MKVDDEESNEEEDQFNQNFEAIERERRSAYSRSSRLSEQVQQYRVRFSTKLVQMKNFKEMEFSRAKSEPHI